MICFISDQNLWHFDNELDCGVSKTPCRQFHHFPLLCFNVKLLSASLNLFTNSFTNSRLNTCSTKASTLVQPNENASLMLSESLRTISGAPGPGRVPFVAIGAPRCEAPATRFQLIKTGEINGHGVTVK